MDKKKKKESKIKKALKWKIKLTIVTALIVVLVIALIIGAISSSLKQIQNAAISYVTLYIDGEPVEAKVEDKGCKCRCLWVSLEQGQTGSEGSTTPGYGASTGSLTNNNVHSQILELGKILESKLGMPVWTLYGFNSVENSGSLVDENRLYSGSSQDIYTGIMTPVNHSNYSCFEGKDPRKGKLIRSGAALGPFQVMPRYATSWVARIPEDYLTEIGKSSDNDITNRGNGKFGNEGDTANPLYLPDVMYGIAVKYNWRVASDKGESYFSSTFDDWSYQSENVKNAVYLASLIRQYSGGGGITSSNEKGYFRYAYDFAKAYFNDPSKFTSEEFKNATNNYSQHINKNEAVLTKEVCKIIDPDGSKGHWDNFINNWGRSNNAEVNVQWDYAAKSVIIGFKNLESAVTKAGGDWESWQNGINSSSSSNNSNGYWACDCQPPYDCCDCHKNGVLPGENIGGTGDNSNTNSNSYIWPIADGIDASVCSVSSAIKPRGTEKLHNGIDISTRRVSKAVVAIADGEVVAVNRSGFGDRGCYVKIQHANIATVSQHFTRGSIPVEVKPGAKVVQGQLIGMTGSTGRSTGIHLHFEVHEETNYKTNITYTDRSHIRNPLIFFKENNCNFSVENLNFTDSQAPGVLYKYDRGYNLETGNRVAP